MRLLPLIILLLRAARALPASWAWGLGRFAGATFAQWGGRDPQRALEHLARAFPQRSPQQLRHIQRRAFAHAGAMALWTLRSLGEDPKALIRGMAVEGGPQLKEMLRASQRGQGTVVFTAHFGNWELLGRSIGAVAPATVVGRRMRSALADGVIKWMRTATGCEQIDQQEGLRPVLRSLRGGRIIGCLADQDVPALSGAFVPWFGEQAYTPTGPALLAAMTPECCFQVVLCYRQSYRHGYGHSQHWCIHAGPRWTLPAGDRAEAAHALTARATAYIQDLVARHPEQWVWWHKRWRTRPEQRPQAPLWQGPA